MKGENLTRVLAGTVLVLGLGFQNPKASAAADRGNQASTSRETETDKNVKLAKFISAVDAQLRYQDSELNSHAEDLKIHSRTLENHSNRLEVLEKDSSDPKSTSRMNKLIRWISSRGAFLAALEIFKRWF
jgi:uncharacterized protein YozE (UPF0346 family)